MSYERDEKITEVAADVSAALEDAGLDGDSGSGPIHAALLIDIAASLRILVEKAEVSS